MSFCVCQGLMAGLGLYYPPQGVNFITFLSVNSWAECVILNNYTLIAGECSWCVLCFMVYGAELWGYFMQCEFVEHALCGLMPCSGCKCHWKIITHCSLQGHRNICGEHRPWPCDQAGFNGLHSPMGATLPTCPMVLSLCIGVHGGTWLPHTHHSTHSHPPPLII